MLRWHPRGRAGRNSTRGRNNSDISDGGRKFMSALKPELLDAWLTGGRFHENSMRDRFLMLLRKCVYNCLFFIGRGAARHDMTTALKRSSGQGKDVNVYGRRVRFVTLTRRPLTA